jgi:uncharacterized OsmC-like protein
MTAKIVYEGDLRCSCTHVQSGTVIETDAPTDNRGKGERFSPTDLLCVSLATCAVTTMGIRGNDMEVDLKNSKMEVTKHMLANPRRVGKIDIELFLQIKNGTEADCEILEKIGNNCPVFKSINPEIEVNINYNWEIL